MLFFGPHFLSLLLTKKRDVNGFKIVHLKGFCNDRTYSEKDNWDEWELVRWNVIYFQLLCQECWWIEGDEASGVACYLGVEILSRLCRLQRLSAVGAELPRGSQVTYRWVLNANTKISTLLNYFYIKLKCYFI